MLSLKQRGEMNKSEMRVERTKLQAILDGFKIDLVLSEASQQGALDRVFAEDRIKQLISRIGYMDAKIAWLVA